MHRTPSRTKPRFPISRQAWEAMMPEERAAADEARRQWRDGMSAEELAEVEERRRAMLPQQ